MAVREQIPPLRCGMANEELFPLRLWAGLAGECGEEGVDGFLGGEGCGVEGEAGEAIVEGVAGGEAGLGGVGVGEDGGAGGSS